LWVLLTLSVALNLCFVAGAVWIRLHPPPQPLGPSERLRRIAEELPLDPHQKQAFDRYAETVGILMEKMHRQVDPLTGEAWSELGKTDADEKKILQALEEAGEARRGFMRAATEATMSFLTTLSPEQRAQFVDVARRRPKPWAPFSRGIP
jgi:uncharacterized membrane protein